MGTIIFSSTDLNYEEQILAFGIKFFDFSNFDLVVDIVCANGNKECNLTHSPMNVPLYVGLFIH